MIYTTRFATLIDKNSIYQLYKNVSKNIGGIAREEAEITEEYITNNLEKSLKNGVSFVIENPEDKNEIIAEIHGYKLEPKVFEHIISEVTIVIHPNFQSKGLGKLIFSDFLNYIQKNRKDILRVELIARESNEKAIDFYQKIGFFIEGRLENRIFNKNTNSFEADIPMAWFNKEE